MVKWLGHALVSCALWITGIEIIRFLDTRQLDFLSLKEVWQILYPRGLDGFSQAVTAGSFPGLWDGVVLPLIMLPMLFIMLLPGLLCEFLAFKLRTDK